METSEPEYYVNFYFVEGPIIVSECSPIVVSEPNITSISQTWETEAIQLVGSGTLVGTHIPLLVTLPPSFLPGLRMLVG